jgi:hypothetical protein
VTRKKLPAPTIDRHIDLYKSDWEFIESHFGRSSSSRFGAARFVREVVHLKVKALRAKEIEALDGIGGGEEKQNERLAKLARPLGPEATSEDIL